MTAGLPTVVVTFSIRQRRPMMSGSDALYRWRANRPHALSRPKPTVNTHHGGPDDDSHARVWLSPPSMAAIEGPALDQFAGWVGFWM